MYLELKQKQMKPILKILLYALIVGGVVLVHSLFFIHHPPQVQLAFLTPGVTLLGYCLIRDDLYKKPKSRLARARER
jgi:hypothetical protein